MRLFLNSATDISLEDAANALLADATIVNESEPHTATATEKRGTTVKVQGICKRFAENGGQKGGK